MTGAPYLARFSRDVGYHSPRPKALNNEVPPKETGRVPHVRQSVHGPKSRAQPVQSPLSIPTRPNNPLTLTLFTNRLQNNTAVLFRIHLPPNLGNRPLR